ncbi:ABC transporter ATP-binding protein [Tsukamurella spumae]|uniref:Trehalose import ATP-binding protein SugC n=1 Tax=Tsukamurella spumae TaxID=44753 RepID=A0A846X2T3_9ACTN|nr:ATP-binding cassette domain-containing protein [Tsukamurella spumae]NKY19401.1 ATP-binding cassette domain-containing protein [Tsukamurella spumae]
MATVRFDGATVQYPGAERPSVSSLDLDIADGEFVVLVGPSGCGKSTSLRALAGLEAVTDGHILIDDVDVTAVSPKKRDVAMVFQNYALYPNMTVAGNMGFALRNAGVSKEDTAKRVAEAAAMLELEPLLDRKPARLSGGQRQRVAMGRAIVRHPKVFAMDEPLSNLDARLRVSTRSQISALQRRLGVTTLYVTHDQVEAMTMGDRVAVLKDGLLQQVAPPRELYDDPVNTFVAGFLGSPGMNLLTVPRSAAGAELAGAVVPIPRTVESGATVTVGLRPEGLQVVPAEIPGAARGTVALVEELGAEALVYVGVDGQDKPVVARVDRATTLRAGEETGLLPAAEQALFFHAESGERLR